MENQNCISKTYFYAFEFHIKPKHANKPHLRLLVEIERTIANSKEVWVGGDEFNSGKGLFKTVSKIISRTHNNTKPSERFYHCILSSIEAASPQVRPHLLWQSSKVEVKPDSDDSERNWLCFFSNSLLALPRKKIPRLLVFFYSLHREDCGTHPQGLRRSGSPLPHRHMCQGSPGTRVLGSPRFQGGVNVKKSLFFWINMTPRTF